MRLFKVCRAEIVTAKVKREGVMRKRERDGKGEALEGDRDGD